MTNKPRKRRAAPRSRRSPLTEEELKALRAPWISRSSGMRWMVVFSLIFAAFVAWQLQPTEGLGRGLLFGVLSAAAMWAVFGGMLLFNRWVRGRPD